MCGKLVMKVGDGGYVLSECQLHLSGHFVVGET
jgi:hypothetical protein